MRRVHANASLCGYLGTDVQKELFVWKTDDVNGKVSWGVVQLEYLRISDHGERKRADLVEILYGPLIHVCRLSGCIKHHV